MGRYQMIWEMAGLIGGGCSGREEGIRMALGFGPENLGLMVPGSETGKAGSWEHE